MRNFELEFFWAFRERLPPGPKGEPTPIKILQEDRTAISFSDLYRWGEMSLLLDQWCKHLAPVVMRLLYKSFQQLASEAAPKDGAEPWKRASYSLEALCKTPEPPAPTHPPAEEDETVTAPPADVEPVCKPQDKTPAPNLHASIGPGGEQVVIPANEFLVSGEPTASGGFTA